MTYLRARYYDSEIKRFISEDPAKDGLNWYGYCGNNPVMFVDPSGMISEGGGIYLDYYYNRIFDAQEQQYNVGNSGYEDWEIEELGYRYEDEINHSKSQINNILSLDKRGLIIGKSLNVPVYNQLNVSGGNGTNLCWATSAAMFISYEFGDSIDRTEQIAKNVAGAGNVFNVPRAWQSTDTVGVGSTKSQKQYYPNLVFTEAEIANIISSGHLFATLYLDSYSGHWVTGIGYAKAPGYSTLIVSNDPYGGIQRIQTYGDYKTYADGRIWKESVR